MNRRALLTIPLPLVLLSLLSVGCGKPSEEPDLIRPVRTMRVADVEQLSRRVFPGRAEATQAVDLSFDVQGQLIERPVNVGDEVTKGQVLARLDPRDYENELQATQARLKQAEAYLARIEKAVQTGAVAEQDLTDAVAQRDTALANVNIKKKALDDSVLFAPFDGTVSATYVKNFQSVEGKQNILRLLDSSRMELKIDIPEQIIMLASHLGDITVTFESHPENPVPAEVKEIGNEASATTRTYPLTLIMDQPAGFTILAGMTGMVRGNPKPPEPLGDAGIEILGSAVFEDGGQSYVWVLDEAGPSVHRQEVKPQGVTSFGMKVSGLNAGQTIVTAGAHHLSEGQMVRLMDEGDDVNDGGARE